MGPVHRWILVALAGSVICTVLDHLHATHGVLTYAHVAFWDQAWWVPLLFFSATLSCLFGARMIRGFFRAPPIAPNPPARIALDGTAFGGAYAMTSFTHAAPTTTLLVLVAFWVARILRGPEPWIVVLSLATAVAGPLVEATVSATGAFTYEHPDFMGVTRWLPAIYLFVGPISARLEAVCSGSVDKP